MVELCTELFLLSSLPCFPAFADLLFLHLLAILMLLVLYNILLVTY